MKVYFTSSLRGKKEFGQAYRHIVKLLKESGFKVYADHILKTDPTKPSTQSHEEAVKAYKHLNNLRNKSDLLVVEASYPSLGVGHEISLALDANKPVVVTYKQGNSPRLLEGTQDDRLFLISYKTKEDLDGKLVKAVNKAKNQMDVRFNFFVTPQILSYLDWIAKTRKVPRAVHLRRLIKEDMKKNQEYQEELGKI